MTSDMRKNVAPEKSDAMLDAIDMLCPLPVLKARKVLRSMEVGHVLHVSATDPGAVADFQSFCEAQGHILRHTSDAGDVFEFWIEKGA